MKERRKEDKRLGLGVATVGRGISLPGKTGLEGPKPQSSAFRPRTTGSHYLPV